MFGFQAGYIKVIAWCSLIQPNHATKMKSPQIKQFHKFHLWRNLYLKEKIQFLLLKLVLYITLIHIFSGGTIEWYASMHIRNKAPLSYYSHYVIPITIMKLNSVIGFSFFLLGKHIAWIRENYCNLVSERKQSFCLELSYIYASRRWYSEFSSNGNFRISYTTDLIGSYRKGTTSVEDLEISAVSA